MDYLSQFATYSVISFVSQGIFVFCVFVAISSLASAFAPSYPLLLVLRGIVGFGLSGGAQAYAQI